MAQPNLKTIYNIELEIGVSKTSDTWTYAPLSEGIDNIAESKNETAQQYFFLSDKGFARNHITAMAPSFTVSGKRVLGDTAQDYIISKKYALDSDRVSSLKLTYTDNSSGTDKTYTLTCDCTLSDIQDISGASTDDTVFSVEIKLDGKPTETTA